MQEQCSNLVGNWSRVCVLQNVSLLFLFLVLDAFYKAFVLSNEDDMLVDSFDNCLKHGPAILTPLGGAQIKSD